MIMDFEDLVSGECSPAMSGKLRRALKRKRAQIKASIAKRKAERKARMKLGKSLRSQRRALRKKGIKFKARRKILKSERQQLRSMRKAARKARRKRIFKGLSMFSPTARKIHALRMAKKGIARRRALKKKPLRSVGLQRKRLYRI